MSNWINHALDELRYGRVNESDQLYIASPSHGKATTDRKGGLETTLIGRLFRFIGRALCGPHKANNQRTNDALLEAFKDKLTEPTFNYLKKQSESGRPLSYGRLKKVVDEAEGLNSNLRRSWARGSNHAEVGKYLDKMDAQRSGIERLILQSRYKQDERELIAENSQQIKDHLEQTNYFALKGAFASSVIKKLGITPKDKGNAEKLHEAMSTIIADPKIESINELYANYKFSNIKVDRKSRRLAEYDKKVITEYIQNASSLYNRICDLKQEARGWKPSLFQCLGIGKKNMDEADDLTVIVHEILRCARRTA